MFDELAVELHVFAVALHRELLQVGREAFEILFVRQHRDGLRAEEVVVPNRDQPHDHRQVLLERRGAEVLVHLVEPEQHLFEMRRPDGQHRREPDRRVHRIPAADPIPEAEHVGRIDAELLNLGRVGRHRDEVFRDRRLIAVQLAEQPGARRVRVGHGLQRREGLRGDDEQRLLGVEIDDRFGEIRAVDVRDEPERHVAPAEGAQGLVRHDRTEIGAADADVDDVTDAVCRCVRASRRCECDRRRRSSCRELRARPARRRGRRRRSIRHAARVTRRAARRGSRTR